MEIRKGVEEEELRNFQIQRCALVREWNAHS